MPEGFLSDVLNLLFDLLEARADVPQMEEAAAATGGEATRKEEEHKDSEDEVMEKLFARCFKFLVALAR